MDCRALALAITPPGLPRLGRPARTVASRPRRRRQSGSALRKLIRSVAAAGFSSGEVKRYGRDLRTKPELSDARQGYWDRLLMGPDHEAAEARTRVSSIS